MFIFRETETARVGEGQRERETENPKQALHCRSEPEAGFEPTKLRDHDLGQNQESDA